MNEEEYIPEEELNEDPCINCPCADDKCVCGRMYAYWEKHSTTI